MNQQVSPQREAKHICMDHAIEKLDHAIDQLRDLKIRISEGQKSIPETSKEPPRVQPTLSAFLNDGQDRLLNASERIGQLVEEISTLIF